jgi:hypothetical protein
VPIVCVMLSPQDAAQNVVEERKEHAISDGLKDRHANRVAKIGISEPFGPPAHPAPIMAGG